jgi:hypothetical protein
MGTINEYVERVFGLAALRQALQYARTQLRSQLA